MNLFLENRIKNYVLSRTEVEASVFLGCEGQRV